MVASSKPPVIETRALTKVFKDFWMRPRVTAIDALDLAITPGEVFGLLGPNGSGKSTTIKIILGLLFPTRGKAVVLGKLPTDTSIKRRLGYLPEESYLYPFLNARETLDYYGRLFGLDSRSRAKRIDMLLEMVGLEAVQRRPIGEFSKGMQRRIGLAQALINDPDTLILDEPTTGLDPIGTRQIKDLILELKRRGKTVLLSSHLLADVEDVCDRVAILYGGRKRAEGTVDQLLAVDHVHRIETDELKPQTIQKIEQLLEREEGKAIRKVDVPRQRLEQLFLDIVHRAQAEGASTSGATAGGAVAEFLARDAHMPEQIDGHQLIEQLTSQTPAPAESTDSEPVPDTAGPDESILGELSGSPGEQAPVGPAEDSPARSTGSSQSHEDDSKRREQVDRDVLDDLTGGAGR
jgi:ABC-2 type transport system ATP-binding protein